MSLFSSLLPLILLLFVPKTLVQASEGCIELKRQVNRNRTQMVRNHTSFSVAGVSTPITITNFKDLQYYATVSIGYPPQSQTFVFDTGSHILWVPYLGSHKSFNIQESTTAYISDQSGSIQYGSGYVAGYYGSDFLTVASLGINVNQSLLWSYYQDEQISYMQPDGILGLSNLLSVDNFLDLALQKNQINSSRFAFELKFTNESSYFYAGNIPERLLTNSRYVDAIESDYWMMDVLGLEIGDDFIRSNSKQAVVDSGTSFLILSGEAFNSLWNSISNICQAVYSLGIICPCVDDSNINLYPQISIYGYGVKFILTPYDYIVSYEGSDNQCLFSVSSGDDLNFMLFGDVFMRRYPVIYNKKDQKIGFHGALEMGIIDTKFIRAIEWMWLAFAIIVLMMIIGIRIGIALIRKKARRTPQSYYTPPNRVYVN